MTSKDKDVELDNYLQGDSDLSRRYRQADDLAPPPSLDTTILAASRRAVGSRPQLAASPFGRTWAIPVSIAAVLMLSVGLINFMGEQELSFDETSYAPPKLRGGVERSKSKNASGTMDIDEPKLKKPMAVQEEGTPQPGAAGVRIRGFKQQHLQTEDRAESGVKAEQATKDISPTKRRAPSPGAILGSSASKPGRVEDPTATLDAWLDHIRKLQREGKIEEAKASFKIFLKRYPDYPITDEFEGLN